ncbi:hypothetical protein CKO44_12545 [Rubrivivax gelatinosus]|uniref:gamma-glutamylcyclotransferase family protein n=1 Tax=Rubrivivax gelatinosus TaxID=28068 RepID=UPI001903B767|nr:gamma-glutamylcyclotransferase family protein [Rubrivivax gelatinosus]MBK1614297.1 hypothetical protein [Rubrivivax gelatinosus]
MKQPKFTRVPGLVFVYGWQLDDRLRARCGAKGCVVGTARLPDHDLGFFGHSARWDGAEEAVFEAPEREVWGLLLALRSDEAAGLDDTMNVREDGSGSHFHCPVEVEDSAGALQPALIYQMAALGPARTPSREYLERIATGAAAHALPPAWVERLRSVPAHPASYPVPHGLRTLRVSVASGGCHC